MNNSSKATITEGSVEITPQVKKADECTHDFTYMKPLKQRHPCKPRKKRQKICNDEQEAELVSHAQSLENEEITDKFTGNGGQPSSTPEPLTPLDVYIHELKWKRAIQSCDDTFMQFVLQDCSETGLLKSQQFSFVERASKSFEDGCQWVFHCSCNPYLVEKRMTSEVNMKYIDFVTLFPMCIHATALKEIIAVFDATNDICCGNFFSDHAYSNARSCFQETNAHHTIFWIGEEGAVCLTLEDSVGIVIPFAGHLKCCTCKNKLSCVHIKALQTIIETGEDDELINSFSTYLTPKNTKYETYHCFSKQIINFNDLKKHHNTNLRERFNIESNGQFYFKITPQCRHQLTIKDQTSVLILPDTILHGKVEEGYCTICEKKYNFDGHEHGVLNMGTFLFSHEVLTRQLYSFLLRGETLHGEYSILRSIHSSEDFLNHVSYQRLRQAWYKFISLLDLEDIINFRCDICVDNPNVVLMDGTSLSVRKHLLPWSDYFTNISTETQVSRSYLKDRIAISSRETRLSIRKFVNRGIHNDDLEKLKMQLSSNAPELMKLLEQLNLNVKGDECYLPNEWNSFFLCLASDSSLCHSFSEELFEILYKENVTNILNSPILLKELQEISPVVFNLITMNETMPNSFWELIEIIKSKSLGFLNKYPCQIDNNLTKPSDNFCTKSSDNFCYFEHLPKVRERGIYDADKNSIRQRECRKKIGKGHPYLGPGTFTLFCQHGICYGYQMMQCQESPNIPFTVLRTRFKEAPKLVIYDNACHLSEYCLNRDPTFFARTQFRIDTLHWVNHTACSPAFELKAYPQHQKLNSQMVEQSNSKLKKLRPMLSYMTVDNFKNHLKLFLGYWNKLVREKH